MRAAPLALLGVVLLSSVAGADSVIAGDAEPRPKPPTRHELRLGTGLGTSDVGDAEGSAGLIYLAVGYRRGDAAVLGELQYADVGDDIVDGVPEEGLTAARLGGAWRGALIGRYNILSGSPDGPISGDFWLEGGLGYEHVAWQQGGVLDRPFAALGFGTELDARPSPGGKRRHVGPYLGFRTQFAQDPTRGEMATCGGPCTRATRPSPLDVSVYVLFGIHTGR